MVYTGWFRYASALLALLAVLTIPVLAYGGIKDVRVETKTVKAPPPKTAVGAEGVLGEPQQTIQGADLNPALEGATCGAYQYKDGVALVCK